MADRKGVPGQIEQEMRDTILPLIVRHLKTKSWLTRNQKVGIIAFAFDHILREAINATSTKKTETKKKRINRTN